MQSARVMISAMAGERVLIVDDDEGVRESTGDYLTDHGFKVAFAADGGEMRKAFGYEGCPIVLVAKARPKTVEPVRKFKPRPGGPPVKPKFKRGGPPKERRSGKARAARRLR